MPTEREIRVAQRDPIAAKPGELSAAQKNPRVVASAQTAPATVIDRGEAATRAWLRWRVSGREPGAVIPRSLWASVPPAAAEQRIRGGARTDGVKAVSAYAQNGGWVVVVVTRDPRMPQVVVEFDKTEHVRGVSG